jgi:hypothetical protein
MSCRVHSVPSLPRNHTRHRSAVQTGGRRTLPVRRCLSTCGVYEAVRGTGNIKTPASLAIEVALVCSGLRGVAESTSGLRVWEGVETFIGHPCPFGAPRRVRHEPLVRGRPAHLDRVWWTRSGNPGTHKKRVVLHLSLGS